MYLSGFWTFIVFILLSVAFGAAALITSYIVNTKAPNPVKQSPYECGIQPLQESQLQFDVKYYLYALMFLLFDVETVFLFPWAVMYEKLGLFALIEGVIFILILVIGLVYVVKRKILEWN